MKHTSSEKNRKNRGRAVGLVCLMGFVLGGCVVTESKYDAAVADLESAKMELEKSRVAHDALQRDNEQLRTENDKVAQDLDVMSAEIQRIKESRENERHVLDEREAELERKSQAVKQSLKKFQQEYQKTKSQNRALRDTIQRYQKELKEARKTGTGRQASAAAPAKKPATSGQSMTKKTRRSGSASDQEATPLKDTVRPVNINTASVQNLVLFLELNRETAERIVANRPYRLRGELIAKRVLPKVTFDVIRDKITAAPRPRPQ